MFLELNLYLSFMRHVLNFIFQISNSLVKLVPQGFVKM